jgi:hypothetical protein
LQYFEEADICFRSCGHVVEEKIFFGALDAGEYYSYGP